MFSSRMFAALALLAAVAAYPADQEYIPRPITTLTDADFDDGASWWSFPSLDTFFAPLLNLFPSFSEIGPIIDIEKDKFRVVVNVKGYKKDDLKVKIKNDFIFIQGAHEAKDNEHDLFASQFFHTYSLPPNASASDVVARFYPDGYLVIVSPITSTADTTRDTEVEVPITEESEPFKKKAVESTEAPEVATTVEEQAPPEIPVLPAEQDIKTEGTTNLPTVISEDDDRREPTTISEDDDRREPTTSSYQEEVTEKDNSIPHGPEASEANELNEVQP